MSAIIRFPNITSGTPAEQIAQIRSYLHQLVQQLNWTLSNLESGSPSAGNELPASGVITEETIREMKNLISQATTTVNTYYAMINNKLKSQYVSQHDFDHYTDDTDHKLAELDTKYVAQADFGAYKQENDQVIDNLQQTVTELTQRIDTLTGGE